METLDSLMDLEKLSLRRDSVDAENALRHGGFERAIDDRWSLGRLYSLPILRITAFISIFLTGVLLGTNYPTWISVYARRPSRYISHLPVSLYHTQSYPDPTFPLLPQPREDIPNIVHYVYGLDITATDDFPYYAYLGMRSAMVTLRPEKIMFHCLKEPSGFWWEQVKFWKRSEAGDETETEERLVEVVWARNPKWIGKDKKIVTKFAHKADILRLEVLQEYGGIYLDIDTFVLSSFKEAGILAQDFVLGMEAQPLDFEYGFEEDEMRPKGLCNAIIVARKGSSFLEKWIESYEWFDPDVWSDHSVRVPWHLAQAFPTEITVLSDRTFFWPTWVPNDIAAVYEGNEYDFLTSGQLAYHLWESRSKGVLRDLDPDQVWRRDTSFTRMASSFMAHGERDRWRAHLTMMRGMGAKYIA